MTLSKLLNLLVLSSVRHMIILTIKGSENEYKTSVPFLVTYGYSYQLAVLRIKIISFLRRISSPPPLSVAFRLWNHYLEVWPVSLYPSWLLYLSCLNQVIGNNKKVIAESLKSLICWVRFLPYLLSMLSSFLFRWFSVESPYAFLCFYNNLSVKNFQPTFPLTF